MYLKHDVLDKGFVALVDVMGSDKAVCDAARVSYSKDTIQEGDGDIIRDSKLISYLLKNKHTSPFESVIFKFEVKAPIFIFRQWHRHRTWSYNEISGRYTALPTEYYVPTPEEIGAQSTSNKQARVLNQFEEAGVIASRISEVQQYQTFCDEAFAQYERLLASGWPRELARMLLPVSTYSRMVATVDLHNLLHFLRLRLHSHAQKEIQEYAKAMLYLIKGYVPYTWDAFVQDIKSQPGYEHLT